MKKQLLFAACLVMAVFSLCLWQQTNTVTAEDSLIRFHVIANSDSETDQAVKLKVRDAVLAHYAKELEACANYQEAYNYLSAHSEELAEIARQTLSQHGFTYGARVELGTDVFPTKSYGDLTLAAGEYQAVKIVLGSGEGKNWWCVMFPPLCFVDISQNVGIAKFVEPDTDISGGVVPANSGITEVEVKSKLAELWQ